MVTKEDNRKHKLIESVIYTSLIGYEIKVLESKNDSLVGIEGRIINETRNTFLVDCGNYTKVLLKEQIVFSVNIEGECLKVNGELLKQDLISRIKKIK